MTYQNHIYGFEKLKVWCEARKLSGNIYTLTNGFPNHERFGLTNQIRRAAVSVMANIVEGSSRRSKKDFAHFITISYSSLMEVLSHMYLAKDLDYMDEPHFQEEKQHITKISNQLNALHRTLIQ